MAILHSAAPNNFKVLMHMLVCPSPSTRFWHCTSHCPKI